MQSATTAPIDLTATSVVVDALLLTLPAQSTSTIQFKRPRLVLPQSPGLVAPPRPSQWAGIGLTSVRAPRLEGRSEERSALWDALCRADTGQPICCALIGPEGRGKRRLLDWLVVRARTLSVVDALLLEAEDEDPGRTFLDAVLSSVPGPDSVTLRLGRGALAQTVRGALASTPGPRGWTAIATQVITHLAQSRPVLLALPQPQRSPWAVGLAKKLMSLRGLRVLIGHYPKGV